MNWEYVGVEVRFKIHCSTLQFGVMVRVVQQGRDAFLSYASTTNMRTCDRGGSVRLHGDAPDVFFPPRGTAPNAVAAFLFAVLVLGKQTGACSNRADLHPKKKAKMHFHFSFISVSPELITASFNSSKFALC